MAQKLGQTTKEQVGKGRIGREACQGPIPPNWVNAFPKETMTGLGWGFSLCCSCLWFIVTWSNFSEHISLSLSRVRQITDKDIIMPQLPITQATQHRRVTSSVLSCYQLDTPTVEKSLSPSNALLWHWVMAVISLNEEFLSDFSFSVSLGVRKAKSLYPCAHMHTYAYLLRHTYRTHILCFHACYNVCQ